MKQMKTWPALFRSGALTARFLGRVSRMVCLAAAFPSHAQESADPCATVSLIAQAQSIYHGDGVYGVASSSQPLKTGGFAQYENRTYLVFSLPPSLRPIASAKLRVFPLFI